MGFPHWMRGPVLGRGSTATVSLALADDGVAAVKTAELSSSALLQREQRILSCLRSEHVVACLGFDVTAEGGRELYNLFMEYAPGGSIADEIERRRCAGGKGLEEWRVRSYAKGILLGLSYMHSLGLAHCDVKGRNVLIGSHGEAKLADLGCARWIAGEEDPRRISGTPAFMAPEVARGEEQGMAGDVWSLGCTVVEMATGRSPWQEAADPVSAIRRIAFSDDIPELPEGVSEEGKDFLEKCLRRDASGRWTAEELLRHPFVAVKGEESLNCSPSPLNFNWSSPKCVLDQDLWDDEEEEAAAEEREGESGPSERIGQWACCGGGGDDGDVSGTSWACDDGNWILVRGGGGGGGSGGDIESQCSTSAMVVDADDKDRRQQSPGMVAGGRLMKSSIQATSDAELKAKFSIGSDSYYSPSCIDCLYYCCKYDSVLKERKQVAHHHCYY